MIKEEKIKDGEYKGGKLSEAIITSLRPFLFKLQVKGIREVVEEFIPKLNLNKLVLGKIKSQLLKHRVIELNNIYLNKIEIQYRSGGIQIEPHGFVRLLVRKITITDGQILRSFENILNQIEEKYINDNKYLINKIDEIVVSLSKTGLYKPKNSEEKTLYDLAMLILLNYYKLKKSETPKWINHAIRTIGRGEFLNSWVDILIKYISEVIANVSENVFVNFKVTFDSFFVRLVLDKKTNKGQISSLLKMVDINIKEIIYSFAKSYISPSFIKGIGEILADIASSFLSFVDKKDFLKDHFETSEKLPFNITISPTKNLNSERSFTWYTSKNSSEGYIEYSYDKDLKESTKIKSESEIVAKTFPFINLGLTAGYRVKKLSRHTAVLSDLKPGIVYYKILSGEKIETEVYNFEVKRINSDCNITIFADSQGMIKQDYNVFSKVMDTALKNSRPDFMVHLGDFVDDGNNEEYWNWILDSDHFKSNLCVPLAGNHEGVKNAVAFRAGVKNSIISHFEVKDLPIQDTSKGIYYSFNYKNTTFLILNTNSSENGIGDVQYRYALDVLKNSKSTWKIIFTHKSSYSNGPHCMDSDVKKISKQLSKLAYLGGADIVFGGHDHVYVRTKILSCGKNVHCEKVLEENSFLNPYGTIFLIPGTSGVKNYAQNLKISIPAQKIMSPKGPVYSKLNISPSELTFKSYLVNTETKKEIVIDSFHIKKYKKNCENINYKYVTKLINSIPNKPWLDDEDKIEKIFKIYESLSYEQKVKVKNSVFLFEMLKIKKKFKKITSGEIRIVRTKKEFLEAFKNPKISTIITQEEEIKFSKNSNFIVSRPLCIRGFAKIMNANFILKENSLLTFCDSVCLDNTKKSNFFHKGKNTFKLYSNSYLILNDNSSINSFSEKEKAIKICGENCGIYFNSSSANFTKSGFLEVFDTRTKINIFSGKFLSKDICFNVNCELNIYGGNLESIRGFENSKINIYGGIIGKESKKAILVPIKSCGKVILNSGVIMEKDGVSVLMQNSKDCILEKGELSNPIDIKGKVLYN